MQRTFRDEFYTRPPFPNFSYPGPSKGAQLLPRLLQQAKAPPFSERPGPLGVPGYDARGVGPRG